MFRHSLIALALCATPAFAVVSPDQAARLNSDLTPIGAERGANADGSIPAWQGGLPATPSAQLADGSLKDPYAADQPVFSVTAANMAQYEALLTPGLQAMLKQHPQSLRLPVYPTRRSASYPAAVYNATAENAVKTELANGGNGVLHFQQGVPFPLPSSGVEVVWNHITRYRGGSIRAISNQAVVERDGNFGLYRTESQLNFGPTITDLEPGANLLFFYKSKTLAPALTAGTVNLVHETLDQVSEPRRAWIYNAGQRRVRRAPTLAYDSPGSNSQGLKTTDNLDMYNGAPDRYDWKLLGKRELLIPYNSYRLFDRQQPYENILKGGHLNPDLTRFEKHRVWVVEGTLKPGQRHVYAKRTFYIDEDSWQIALADHYDNRGHLWRVSLGYAMNFYSRQIPWGAMETIHDLQNGRYLSSLMTNGERGAIVFGETASSKDFTPDALRRWGH
ncbi:MAG: DUF1329 domain-containing protein [Pseudomonadales bacterium]|nr:DUF1329 domain-containing protein [Pseudomonadales bacterium]